MSFLDNISDFYHWMAQFDEVNARSRTNYISWLKFLSNNYDIDEHITENEIQRIIDSNFGVKNVKIGGRFLGASGFICNFAA